MRHPVVPALLVLLVLAAYAAVGAAVASGAPAGERPASDAGATPGDEVAGNVTDDDGQGVADAAVLLEPENGSHLREATDGDRAVVESLLRLADAAPDGVHVVRTDGEGRYAASVPAGEYRVVAVVEGAVSRLRTVDANGGARVDLSVDEDRVLSLESSGVATAAPGETVTTAFRVPNTDDEPVEGLVVDLGSLDGGLSLDGVETDGQYDASTGEIRFDAVSPERAVTVTLTVRVPEDAEPGWYRLPVAAASDTHYVEEPGGVEVRVRSPDATPTETYVGGPGAETPTPQPNPTPTARTGTPTPVVGTGPSAATSAPGFGAVAAASALVGVAGLWWRRRRRT